MKVPAQFKALAVRFNRFTLRERLLLLVATVAVVVAAFNLLLMSGLDARRAALTAELTGLESGMKQAATVATANATADSTGAAYLKSQGLQVRLGAVDAQLASQSAGMIPPQRMAEVIHDVLSNQHGVVLVSLRHLASVRLPPEASGSAVGAPGPYLHTVEMVVDGPYLDVLAYLRALEALPWRFYWRGLELSTQQYPINRVRVELGTVSADSQWIGL